MDIMIPLFILIDPFLHYVTISLAYFHMPLYYTVYSRLTLSGAEGCQLKGIFLGRFVFCHMESAKTYKKRKAATAYRSKISGDLRVNLTTMREILNDHLIVTEIESGFIKGAAENQFWLRCWRLITVDFKYVET